MGCIAECCFFKKGVDRVNKDQIKSDLWNIEIDDIEGNKRTLRDYTNGKKAFIFVNVACK